MRKNIYIPDDQAKQWAAFVRLCKRRRISVSERLMAHVINDLRSETRRRLVEKGAEPPVRVPPNLIILTPEEVKERCEPE